VEENYISKKMKIPFEKFVIGSQIYFNHPRGKGEFELNESLHPGSKKLFSNLVILIDYYKIFKLILFINIKGLSEYYDDEEEDYVKGMLVLDLDTEIPYNSKNNKILEEFALKLKDIEDDKELRKFNKVI